MEDWLTNLGLFLAQLLLLVVVVGLVAAILTRLRNDGGERLRLRTESLDALREQRRRRLALAASEPGARKRLVKAFRRSDKSRRRATAEASSTVWVLDFHGDLRASGASRLGEEVSAVLAAAQKGDEVVLRLESAGGLVHAYGLAAAQVDRLRDAGLRTTVCVDRVAASGGYLMACGADRLYAAPLAVIGSIGVVAQLPNVHRLLKRHDIDVELLTAGEYKRTLTVFGENTPEGRDKFQADLDDTHALFKAHVAERRPSLDIEAVATGEVWYGREALARGLVDALATSEEYLVTRMADARVVSVRLEPRRSVSERLGRAVSHGVEQGVERLLTRLNASRWEKR